MQVKGEFPLTKGPLALFYGGKDIAPLLSSNSTTASNMPLTILCLSSPLLQIFLQLYKKFRFRKEIGYEHQLKQAVMTGFQNVYGSISIFLAFLIFLLLIIGHQYISYHYNCNAIVMHYFFPFGIEDESVLTNQNGVILPVTVEGKGPMNFCS